MKYLISALFFLQFCTGFSQEEISDTEESQNQELIRNNEFRINMFSTIVFSAVDVTYERVLSQDSSTGISLLYNYREDDSENGLYYNEKFAITPFYRYYFSNTKYAHGFFIEGFAMYNKQQDYNRLLIRDDFSDRTSNNFAVGFAAGGKFITKRGIVFDLHAGLGRNIYRSDEEISALLVPRFAISAGYRF